MNFFFNENDIDDKLLLQVISPPRLNYSARDLGKAAPLLRLSTICT